MLRMCLFAGPVARSEREPRVKNLGAAVVPATQPEHEREHERERQQQEYQKQQEQNKGHHQSTAVARLGENKPEEDPSPRPNPRTAATAVRRPTKPRSSAPTPPSTLPRKPPHPSPSRRLKAPAPNPIRSAASKPHGQVHRDIVHLQRQYDDLVAKMHAIAKPTPPATGKHFRPQKPKSKPLELRTPALDREGLSERDGRPSRRVPSA